MFAHSGEGTATSSGLVILSSGNSGVAGTSGKLVFSTGSAKAGNSGGIMLGTGAATGGWHWLSVARVCGSFCFQVIAAYIMLVTCFLCVFVVFVFHVLLLSVRNSMSSLVVVSFSLAPRRQSRAHGSMMLDVPNFGFHRARNEQRTVRKSSLKTNMLHAN